MPGPRPGDTAAAQVVRAEVARVVARRHGRHQTISDADRFETDLALTSLDLVEVVTAIEAALNVDPGHRLTSARDVRTVADLVTSFLALPAPLSDGHPDDVLLRASRARGEARRRAG